MSDELMEGMRVDHDRAHREWERAVSRLNTCAHAVAQTARDLLRGVNVRERLSSEVEAWEEAGRRAAAANNQANRAWERLEAAKRRREDTP